MQTQTAYEAGDIEPATEAAFVAAQNDAFKTTITQFRKDSTVPEGRMVMTRSVSTQSPNFLQELLRSVIAYDAFEEDCDPSRLARNGSLRGDR